MTRKDQLTMKPDKKPTKGRGRGRGRAGRGGRGRGMSELKSNPKKPNQRSGQSDAYDENWWLDEWEYEYGKPGEEWCHEGWGGKEYYWDNYGWWEGQSALHQLNNNDEVKDNKQKQKNAKNAEKEALETTAKTRKSKESNKEPPSTKVSKIAGSDSSRPKRKAKDQEEECPPAKAAKSTTKKKQALQVSESEKATLTKRISKYHNRYQDNTCKLVKDYDEREEMRSRLKLEKLHECRLNIYWTQGTCGVTSKTKKKDICHFSFPDLTDQSYMSRLSICLVCASLFVTWTIRVLQPCFTHAS